MSWWPMSGRYSPFSFYPRSSEPPAVTADDYSYITGADDKVDDGSEPDVLILRHQGTLHSLQFPAYAISDASLTVGEVREAAAKQLQLTSSEHVKLLYKGRQLRDDTLACKQEHLKQNSELLCVISGDRASNEGSEEEPQTTARRKRKGHRGGGKKKKAGVVEQVTAAITPADALLQVQDNFVTNLLPRIEAYIADPPEEPKTRETEYRKLSESTLAQVLIKLDGIETAGDEELRAKRREIIKLAQGWLNKLDAAVELHN